MKILLIGEYNSSHKTLKDGLSRLGHEVTVIGFGDGFKKRTVDITLQRKYNRGLGKKLKVLLYRLLKIDISSIATKKQFDKHKEKFANNDIVQLINEHVFFTTPAIEKELLSYIFKNNKNVFLLSCGTDYISVKHGLDQKSRYSILTPYHEGRGAIDDYSAALKYVQPEFKKLHEFIYQNIKGVIASDLDYHIPLLDHPLYLGKAPNPLNLDTLAYIEPELGEKIIIFHGINRNNYFKKGNDLFEAALQLVKEKHADKIEIITVENIPYDQYIQLYDTAHVLLDQVFAFDQGFNALEGMAKGKVVFTGAEQEWLDYHGLEEDKVAINALPDAHNIASKLEWLILNPENILEISKNARKFVEEKHDYLISAQDYLKKWQSAMDR